MRAMIRAVIQERKEYRSKGTCYFVLFKGKEKNIDERHEKWIQRRQRGKDVKIIRNHRCKEITVIV